MQLTEASRPHIVSAIEKLHASREAARASVTRLNDLQAEAAANLPSTEAQRQAVVSKLDRLFAEATAALHEERCAALRLRRRLELLHTLTLADARDALSASPGSSSAQPPLTTSSSSAASSTTGKLSYTEEGEEGDGGTEAEEVELDVDDEYEHDIGGDWSKDEDLKSPERDDSWGWVD